MHHLAYSVDAVTGIVTARAGAWPPPAGDIVRPLMPPQAVSLRRATTRPLSLALLGPFRARLGDGRPLRIRRRKARALLASEALNVLDRLVAVHAAAGATAEHRAPPGHAPARALDPLRRGRSTGCSMRLHARAGRRNAALRQYRACADAFGRDLDVTPEDETTGL